MGIGFLLLIAVIVTVAVAVFRASPGSHRTSSPTDETEYSARWRERYLRARIEYLKKKIIKNSGVPRNYVIPTHDDEEKLKALAAWIDVLESQLK